MPDLAWIGFDVNKSFLILGVFALLQAYAFIQYLRDRMSKKEFMYLFNFAIVGVAGVVFLAVVGLTYAGRWIL